MKLEFDGRIVAAVALGAICGAVATVVIAAGPIGRIQRERDDTRATVVILSGEVRELQSTIADLQKRLAAAAQQTQTHPQPQSSPLELLNVVRPGLGTLAVAADQAIKADQAKRAAAALEAQQAFDKANAECPPGSRLEPGPWQGLKCVAVGPQ